MSQNQLIFGALILSILIINLPLIGYIKYLVIAGKIQMVIAEFQSVIDQLNNLVTPAAALKATADAASGAPSPTDVSDTVGALQAGVNALALAMGQPSQ